MQPHTAMWKPNPQPSRTNVMTAAVCCGRTDESGEVCALIENDDASTPQVRTNDNLPNIDKIFLLIAFLGALLCGCWRKRAPTILSDPCRFAWISLRMVDLDGRPQIPLASQVPVANFSA
jgi:hypothetical protein